MGAGRYFWQIFWQISSSHFDRVICYHTTKYLDTMFGLPDITILAVGGVVLVVIAALLYWGLTFRGHD